jgi:hypothetical protein
MRNTEGEVALSAVERADPQIGDAQVEDLTRRLLDCDPLLLFFQTLHQLLRIRILICHNVTHTQVCQHYRTDTQ